MAVWEEAASRRVVVDVALSDMEIRNTHADFRAPRRAAVAAAMVIVLGAAALAAALAGAAAGNLHEKLGGARPSMMGVSGTPNRC